jgi:hypothetical protein
VRSTILRWTILAAVALLTMASPAPALDGATGAKLADLLAKFDAYAESSRQRWDIRMVDDAADGRFTRT